MYHKRQDLIHVIRTNSTDGGLLRCNDYSIWETSRPWIATRQHSSKLILQSPSFIFLSYNRRCQRQDREGVNQQAKCDTMLGGVFVNISWNTPWSRVDMELYLLELTSGIYALLMNLPKYCPVQILTAAYYGLIYPHPSFSLTEFHCWGHVQLTNLWERLGKTVQMVAQAKNRVISKNLNIFSFRTPTHQQFVF